MVTLGILWSYQNEGGGLNRIVHGDNLEALRRMETGSAALIYIDPPFNTGKREDGQIS
jgi:site-specific DNA-methyltransferase (adenine-specific)